MTRGSKARILAGTARNIAFLAEKLRAGELVAVPTETVYGLAANALDARACAAIFRAKRRPRTDPLIVHVASLAQLSTLCDTNAAVTKLARRFWPGPLTLVLPKKSTVPDIVSAGRDSVAVRLPQHGLFRKLLRQAAIPLAAPSANPFGYVSPTTAEHVQDGLGDRIPYILDGGASKVGLESTIVDVRNPRKPVLLRPGAITRLQLEDALGCPVRVKRKASSDRSAQIAPGLLARHYSPRTPVSLQASLGSAENSDEAYVYLRRPKGPSSGNVYALDPRGDLRGAARRLFAVLRQLDQGQYRRIHVELARGEGLADAINDRLRRAAAR